MDRSEAQAIFDEWFINLAADELAATCRLNGRPMEDLVNELAVETMDAWACVDEDEYIMLAAALRTVLSEAWATPTFSCPECTAEITGTGESEAEPPGEHDDAGWAALAVLHNDGCAWIEGRAGQIGAVTCETCGQRWAPRNPCHDEAIDLDDEPSSGSLWRERASAAFRDGKTFQGGSGSACRTPRLRTSASRRNRSPAVSSLPARSGRARHCGCR